MVYWAQKKIKKENREKIISCLIDSPKTFKELMEKTRRSKPVLSKHLDELKKKGDLIRTVIDDRVVYKVTEKAKKEKGYIKRIQFEVITYNEIILELRNKLTWFPSHLDLLSEDEQIKNALEFINIIDTWITPIAFYLMLKRRETNEEWSLKPLQSAISDIVGFYVSPVEDISKKEPLDETSKKSLEKFLGQRITKTSKKEWNEYRKQIAESFKKALKQRYPQQIEELEKRLERADEYIEKYHKGDERE